MWISSIGKECNSSQVNCQAKGWFQKSQVFSNDLEMGVWSGKMEGEKMDSHGKVLKIFSPLKILNSPFSKERDSWSFSSFLFFLCFFFSLFFYASFSLLFFYAPSLYWGWTRWFLKCLRRKQYFFKLSFKWDGSGYTKNYEIGGVVENLSAVDAYPGIDFFLREARAKEGKIILKHSKAQEEHIS
jgi:hypothetical protein